MKNIIKRIISKDLRRDNDEAYAKGFYDKAGEFFPKDMDEQMELYYIFWEIFEETTKQILKAQNRKIRKISPIGEYTPEDIIRENNKIIKNE